MKRKLTEKAKPYLAMPYVPTMDKPARLSRNQRRKINRRKAIERASEQPFDIHAKGYL